MAKNKFIKDLEIGGKGEQVFVDLLLKNNIECKRGDGRKADVILWDGRIVEIKLDLMSAKTNNIAVEFFNSKKVEPSGITSTTSNFWVFVLPCGQIWITQTSKLRVFIEANKPLRIVFGAGDDNADLKLYKKDFILPNCFDRIDELDETQIRTLLGVHNESK